MRVGIDARHARLGLGIGVFVRELCAELVVLPDTEVVWFGDPRGAPDQITHTRDISSLPYPFLDSPLGRRLVARSDVDVFHFTGNTGWGRPGPVPTVLTIHDLIFMRTRARSARQLIGHRYERANVRAAARCAGRVAVPSRVSRQEVLDTLAPPSSPSVVPQGVTPPDEGGTTRSPATPRPSGYVVAFSGSDPRKNVSAVLLAMRSTSWPGARLRMFAGAGIPEGFLEDAAPELDAGLLELLPRLPRTTMWTVLAGADALVYPTLSEGFGLPVIEAMSVGVPVVTGLAPVTREVGGDAIATIDALSPGESIARAVRELAGDTGKRREMVERGLARAAEFTWRRTAERYRALYAELLR